MSGQAIAALRIDPEFHALIPPLSEDERRQLEENIKADGIIRDPLVVWAGVLLDGHNRYEIGERLGIGYRTVEREFPSRDAAKVWVIRNQCGRRNLSESQRAMLADKLALLAKGQRKGDAQICVSQSDAAELFGVGTRTVQLARAVREHGVPELVAAVEQDEIAVSTAAEIATLPADEQREVLKQEGKGIIAKARAVKAKRKVKKKAEKQARKKAAPPTTGKPIDESRCRLIVAGVADAAKHVKAGSVDWIVTDPPYPKEYVGLYADLARFAAHALKPGGSLLAMAGQSYLPEVLAALTAVPELRYHWTVGYLTPGGQAVQVWDRKVNTFWKPVLWLVKGKYAGDWVGDVTRSDVNDNDKRFHEWGQSESGIADLLERFTDAGQTVVDPFVGGGSVAAVAVAMGRRFVGLDLEADAIETTRQRVAELAEGRAA